jgi:hypothetical protein
LTKTTASVVWCLLPATRLASRIILVEQNIKKRQGQYSIYSVGRTLTQCTYSIIHTNRCALAWKEKNLFLSLLLCFINNNNNGQKKKSKKKFIPKLKPRYGFLKPDQKHDKKFARGCIQSEDMIPIK